MGAVSLQEPWIGEPATRERSAVTATAKSIVKRMLTSSEVQSACFKVLFRFVWTVGLMFVFNLQNLVAQGEI